MDVRSFPSASRNRAPASVLIQNSALALSRLQLARSDGDLTPEQEKQVQFIRKAPESLTELVNDLLDLAKVEASKTVVTPIEFSAEDL
jgi:signal transduction histidine kinase